MERRTAAPSQRRDTINHALRGRTSDRSDSGGHNSALGPLDEAAQRFFLAIRETDAHLRATNDASAPSTDALFALVKGANLRMWLLKFACGLRASGHSAVNGEAMAASTAFELDRSLVDVLFGYAPWQPSWDFHVITAEQPMHAANAVSVQTLMNARTQELVSASAIVGGLEVVLALGKLTRTGSVRRPARFDFLSARGAVTVELGWPEGGLESLACTLVGTTAELAPWAR